jgi:hypothetical protein
VSKQSQSPARNRGETWVTDQQGDPVFMVIAEPSGSLAAELRRLLPALRQVAGQQRRVTVWFDRGGWSPVLFADITAAGFDVLTWRKGPVSDVPAAEFTTIAYTDDRGGRHEYDLAGTTVELGISDGACKGQTVSLRQVTRGVPAKAGATRQIHALTSRDDLAPRGGVLALVITVARGELLPLRPVPVRPGRPRLLRRHPRRPGPDGAEPGQENRGRTAQAGRPAAQAAETARDAVLFQLRSPAPARPPT